MHRGDLVMELRPLDREFVQAAEASPLAGLRLASSSSAVVAGESTDATSSNGADEDNSRVVAAEVEEDGQAPGRPNESRPLLGERVASRC